MRITSKGQVTIPQAIRERYGLLPDTDVDFIVAGGRVTIVPRRVGSWRGGDHLVVGPEALMSAVSRRVVPLR